MQTQSHCFFFTPMCEKLRIDLRFILCFFHFVSLLVLSLWLMETGYLSVDTRKISLEVRLDNSVNSI